MAFIIPSCNAKRTPTGARSFGGGTKVHGTLRRDVPQDDITIGVAAYRDERELTLGKLLALPFGKQREWRLPNGEQPERAPKAANELAE
jgi:hypothetical protein